MTTENKPKKKTAAQQLKLDRESNMVLFQGASLGQLALLFGKDKRTVGSKIAGKVEPCGTRAGFPVYNVKDAAPYLVPPVGDFEEAIKNMHHDDIPSLLHKNYWAGKRERMRFEEEEGRLVDIFEVQELVAKAYQTARMSLLLMPDAIEREFVLTDDHRVALKRLVDGAISELRVKLTEAFTAPEGLENHDGSDYASPGEPDDGDVFDEVETDGEASEKEDFGGL